MSLLKKIRYTISLGEVLYTPSKRTSFTVERVDDTEGVTFRVGAKRKWKIKVPVECWEGIPKYLRSKGWVRIGAVHGTAEKGTFEAYLDNYIQRSSSSYVVPVLERIEIVEVQHGRPAKIRLRSYE